MTWKNSIPVDDINDNRLITLHEAVMAGGAIEICRDGYPWSPDKQ